MEKMSLFDICLSKKQVTGDATLCSIKTQMS
jgi:hypothetical protein